MNYALIGCGDIGRLRAAALSQSGSSKLVAVSDADKDRAAALAAENGCAIEKRWQDLIHREDVDAIIVSTPPSLHAEMCQAALETGKNVLCEKPLVRNPKEGHALLDVAQQSGKLLATGFNYRFYPSVVKARALLDSGIIGELDHIRSYAGYTAAGHNRAWIRDVDVMGGGALRDNGIHLIDLTQYFLGDVAEVKGWASNSVWGFEGCEDNGFALLRSAEGKIATLQASWTEWKKYRFMLEIYGQRGCITLSCFPMLTQVVWSATRGGSQQRKTDYFWKNQVMEKLRSYRWVVVQSFMQEFNAFEQAIRGEKTPLATGWDGLRAVEIADLASREMVGGRRKSAATSHSFLPTPSGEVQTSTSSGPAISVVVVPIASRQNIDRCLDALQHQVGAPPFEVIVPHDEFLGDMAPFIQKFPEVRFLEVSGKRTFAELRAHGVQMAGGEIVALTEDHCIPNPEWCAQIHQSHALQPYIAIGGPVDKKAPDTALNWAVYFADYVRYANPISDGPANTLTDINVTYKRAPLKALEEIWRREFHEPAVHAALREQGEILWLSPRLAVEQQRSLRLGPAIRERFAYGRLFASTRVATSTGSKRLIFLVAAAAVPALLLLRVAMHVYRRKRWINEFARALPVLTLLSAAWGLGEFSGYATGRADTSQTPSVEPVQSKQAQGQKASL